MIQPVLQRFVIPITKGNIHYLQTLLFEEGYRWRTKGVLHLPIGVGRFVDVDNYNMELMVAAEPGHYPIIRV